MLFSLGGRRFSEGTSADREIQRTLMEVKLIYVKSGILQTLVLGRQPKSEILRLV